MRLMMIKIEKLQNPLLGFLEKIWKGQAVIVFRVPRSKVHFRDQIIILLAYRIPNRFRNHVSEFFKFSQFLQFLVCLFVKYYFYIFCTKQFLYFCKNSSFVFSEFVSLVSLTNVLKNSEIVTCSSDCCTKPESKNSHFFMKINVINVD